MMKRIVRMEVIDAGDAFLYVKKEIRYYREI